MVGRQAVVVVAVVAEEILEGGSFAQEPLPYISAGPLPSNCLPWSVPSPLIGYLFGLFTCVANQLAQSCDRAANHALLGGKRYHTNLLYALFSATSDSLAPRCSHSIFFFANLGPPI